MAFVVSIANHRLKVPFDDNCFMRTKNICSLGGAFVSQIRHSRVGHLNTTLAQGGGILNEPIFKSSNARGGLPGGLGVLNFRIHRRIRQIFNVQVNISHTPGDR